MRFSLRYFLLAVASLLIFSANLQSQVLPEYDYRITPVDVANTTGNDYAPTLSKDHRTLWFCSYERPEGFGNADVYRSVAPEEEGEWESPLNAGSNWNYDDNEGAIAIAADGKTIVIATDGRDGYGDTDLFIAELEGDSVKNVRNLGKNVNSRYWDSQPSITGDGKTIYFASTRPGGYGGVDIWVTHNVDGVWSRAIPLDSTINTVDNERSPFVIQNGTSLFFSSDRPGGFGKEDFWVSYLTLGDWQKPLNLGGEINSSEDELFFHAPPGSKYFYFASNRRGPSMMLDIYAGSPNVFGDGRYLLDIEIVDSLTGQPIPAYVTVTDIEENHIVWEFTTDSVGLNRYQMVLPAGRDYQITARRSLKDVVTFNVVDPVGERGEQVKLGFNLLENALPERELILFDLGEYNVPFFVTGYYRPNTPESLPELLDMLGGSLSKATYIERFPRGSARHKEYQDYSEKIDSILDNMAMTIIDTIAPNFLRLAPANEAMELIVTGYVDPQIFSGLYYEEPVIEFSDINGKLHAVRKGDRIENFELSGMRAVFAQRLVDKMLQRRATSGNPAFLTLLDSGRIRYRTVAGGVSGGQTEYDKQRRIHVLIVRAEK
ncbi:MAG: PD40 domain-containing protein [Ignavibacteriae bacterium]|nr:PD40 domain-containing protein [Ignavibacteriota bacterium]MCB9215223.1 PD40 domain-containing protein [Ignavibacteria bacterium]